MPIIISKIDKKFKKITFIIVYALIAFFFLVNGEGLLPNWSNIWTITTLIYLVGVTIFIAVIEKLPKQVEVPIIKAIAGFSFSLVVMTAFFMLLKGLNLWFQGISPMPSHLIISTIVFQGIIVVPSEETIFRGSIFGYLTQFNRYIAYIGSAFFFAIFHIAVYGASLPQMGFAFAMGLFLAYCVENWNLGVAIGVHLAWNLFVLGITAII